MPMVGNNPDHQARRSLANDFVASRGWVWLGESADNSDSAMDLVNSISKIDFDDSGHELDQDAWTALKRLFQRPWWGRLWVVQESLLAQKVAMNCGTKVVGIENFVQLKEIEQKYRRRPEARLRPMQVGLTSPFGTILSDWKRHKDMIAKGGIPLFEVLSITGECECKDPVDKIFGLLSMCTAEDRQAIRVDCKLKARDLVIMVAKYHFRQRERYSPLKILQTHQAKKDPTLPSWVPDYTKDDFENHFMFPASKDSTPFTAGANNAAWNALASEFHDTPVVTFIAGVSDASKVLKTLWLGPLFIFGGLLWIWRLADQTLQAIRQVSQVLTSPAGGSLLSRAMRSANIMTDTANRLSKTVISALISLLMRNALNSVALRIEDEGLHETLVLPGLVVDNVSDAFPAPDVEFYKGSDMGEDANRKRHRREEMKEACKTWENNVLNLPPGTDPYRKTCGRYDAFWRTVIADRDYTWKGPPPAEWDFAGRFEAWLGRREDRADDEPYFRPFSDAAVIHCLNRSFIVTERGYLGLGRVSTKQGDIVCVLRGGNVPFILRRKGYGYYELVGEAYVHGIMDGTFVRNARKEELKEFRIR
jgi:hypothetical protein